MNNIPADKRERGFSLVEVLAVLVISSLIFVLVTPILLKSLENYEKIKAETVLRDEADLILASLYRELYTTKESEINRLVLENKIAENKYSDSYLLMNNGSIIGFQNGKFLLKNRVISSSQSNVQIVSAKDNKDIYSKVETIAEGVYRITLVLKNTEKNLIRAFENDISTIQDETTD